MKGKKLAKIRRLIESPSYLPYRLKRLEKRFAQYAMYWDIGKHVDEALKAMERTSRKMDRVRGMMDIEQEEIL